jgi:hypothetical protein
MSLFRDGRIGRRSSGQWIRQCIILASKRIVLFAEVFYGSTFISSAHAIWGTSIVLSILNVKVEIQLKANFCDELIQ